MRRIPPYTIFAICGVLFLSMGMLIITADNEPVAPVTEAPLDAPPAEAVPADPVAPVVEPSPLEQVAPPAESGQPVSPPAEIVVQPPPATEVAPVEQSPVEPLPTLEGAPVEQGVVAAGQPPPVVPVKQPTLDIVPPTDLQASVVAPEMVAPVTLVGPVPQPLGTLPPPSNVIPPTAVPLPATVYGQIIMPLRTDFSGVQVILTLADGTVLQTITDSRGVFAFANLLPGNYRVDAGTSGYLSSQFAFALGEGQALTLPPATLIGGDTNADNRIDLSDAVLIAANFNLAATTLADLNRDGLVDIRDLTAIGAYFGQAGPLPWQ